MRGLMTPFPVRSPWALFSSRRLRSRATRFSRFQEYYFQIEQLIHREGISDDGVIQGLGIFAGYYPRFPGPLMIDTSVGMSFVAGAVYTGTHPFPGRGCGREGLAWTELFQGGTNHETVCEFFSQGGDYTTHELAARPAVHCFAVGNSS